MVVALTAACRPTAQPPDVVADVEAVAPAPPPPSPAPSPPDPVAALAEVAAAAAVPDPPGPAWLSIPAIGVESETIDLDLTATEAEVPESFDVAGWYRQTRTPGTVGPAVIVGHVGSRHGPGIFDRLDELRPGDEVHVTDDAGTTRTFVVDSGALVDKQARPPEVFGWGGDRPELRLITCGGEFDTATGHHVSNYVIWAHEVGT